MKVNQFDPFITKEEVNSIVGTLKSNWVTEGEKTLKFQNMLQEYCKVKHVVLLPNGTLALYAALMITGVGPGDEVIVPAFTFVGSATSIVLTGAKPVFADVNMNDFNINIDSLKSCISNKTKAIMPVHIYGQAAEMDKIMAIARERNLPVIEDAAQGLGVTFSKRHVGTIGDLGCMSFYADKTITMGEGGAILTNSNKLAKKCLYFKNQGRLKRGSFVHPELGYNFRITDLQAALGVAQMQKLSFIINKKHAHEYLYKDLLKGSGEVSFPEPTRLGKRVPFRINILVKDPEGLGNYLTKQGIGIRRFFYPLHRQPCFNDNNSVRKQKCNNADRIFAQGLSLPSGVGLSDAQIRYVCMAIKKFFRK